MACFAPNGRYVLAFNLDNCIRLWDFVSGTVKKTYQGHKNEGFAVGGCFGLLPLEENAEEAAARDDGAVNGNGTYGSNQLSSSRRREAAFIACASEDGDVVMWDVTSKEVVQRVTAHPGHVCFWVDVLGDTMITAGQDGTIRVFKHQSLTPSKAALENGVNGDAKVNGHRNETNGEADATPLPPIETTQSAETPIKVEMDVDGT